MHVIEIKLCKKKNLINKKFLKIGCFDCFFFFVFFFLVIFRLREKN